MLKIFLLSAVLTLAYALTDDEIAAFETSGVTELNTGTVGFVEIVSHGSSHTITSNGVPDHDTPDYPNQHNPNDITVQDFSFTFPTNAAFADETTELPLGPIGLAINGVPLFNPYTITGEDAVETETFDSCDGHPDPRGSYHYHKMPSTCVFTVTEGVPSSIVGVARDGFPIYGPIDEDGTRLTSADLDECHGKMSSGGEYRYHTTDDFPYILGCFRGTVSLGNGGGGPPDGGPPDGPPDSTTVIPPGSGGQNIEFTLLLLMFSLFSILWIS
ncbi:uncharacterized protein [Antedon mediterranea]|uniref:uncharacterized protein n=1 Tax=Antedon mediterranea TaxID=105859 RepID=UPI003AF8A970